MDEKFKLFFKGVIVGLGKIIPGVSGGVLAISLGIYEKGLDAINHPFKNWKFLLILGIGILTSVVLISKVINFSLTNYYLPTMLLFVGLIAGGISSLFEMIKNSYNKVNLLYLIISFVLLLLLSTLDSLPVLKSNSPIFLGIMGVVDAFTMVVPGISGTALMMLFGAYDTIIGALSSLTNIYMFFDNFNVLVPFLIGMIIGTVFFVKLIAFLFKKYNDKMYFIIIGLAISSTVILAFQAFNSSYTISEILIGILLFIIGYFLGNKIDEIS